MSDLNAIINRLRMASNWADKSDDWRLTFAEAADEIEYLRLLVDELSSQLSTDE